MVDIFQAKSFRKGQVIIREGETGDSAYLIESKPQPHCGSDHELELRVVGHAVPEFLKEVENEGGHHEQDAETGRLAPSAVSPSGEGRASNRLSMSLAILGLSAQLDALTAPTMM